MASPVLSPPTLFTPADLRSQPTLIDRITVLINNAFIRSKLPQPEKWGAAPKSRFPDHESYLEMLGEEGIVAAIFDDTEVVAVAAAIPWKGGWTKEGNEIEYGWEMKAVAVNGDTRYLRRGLAVQLYTSVEQHLIELQRGGLSGTTEHDIPDITQAARVTLWIQAAECINGEYWRRRGYREVRRDTFGAGTWGCLTSFEMVVLKKELALDV